MPFRWHNAVKNFKWELDPSSALPVAETVIVGQGLYVWCCPLCGCSHNLRADHAGAGIFEPYCLVNVFASQGGKDSGQWRMMRADWLRRFPAAASFTKIMLRAAWMKPTPEAIAAEPEKASDQDAALSLVTKQPRRRRKAAA